MNNKTLYIFAGLFVALLGVFFVLQQYGPRPTDDKATYAVPSLRPGPGPKSPVVTIGRVEIDRAKGNTREKLVFERGDRGWRLLSPAARVDGSVIDRLVDQVRNAHKEESADVSM